MSDIGTNGVNNANDINSADKQSKGGYDDINFEDALGKLEAIVKALESGSIPLDRSLEGFERGIQLIRRCNYLLDNAERKVKILTRAETGEITEADFETSGN